MKLDYNIKFTFILFTIYCFIIFYLKPSCMFHENGNFKDFGLTKDKTIYPFWLSSLLFGFLIYYIILLKEKDYL